MFCSSPSQVTGVLVSSSALAPIDPVPILQTKSLAWPGTCHNNMNMPGGLDPWLKPVTVPGSALLTLHRGCGTGLWQRPLPCHLSYCSWFLSLCPLGSSNPLLLFMCPIWLLFKKIIVSCNQDYWDQGIGPCCYVLLLQQGKHFYTTYEVSQFVLCRIIAQHFQSVSAWKSVSLVDPLYCLFCNLLASVNIVHGVWGYVYWHNTSQAVPST